MVAEKEATVKQIGYESALIPREGNCPEFVVAPTRCELYWTGFNAYCDGARLDDMKGGHMRRGWWAALNAEAAAVTGYDQHMGW